LNDRFGRTQSVGIALEFWPFREVRPSPLPLLDCCLDRYNPRAVYQTDPMNRPDLVDRINSHFPFLDAKDVEACVSTILSALSTRLAEGGRVEIRGFGSFSVGYRPPRVGRNPRTGVKVSVPAKHVPHFKPGTELRERVDKAVKGGKTGAGRKRESGKRWNQWSRLGCARVTQPRDAGRLRTRKLRESRKTAPPEGQCSVSYGLRSALRIT